MCKSRLLILCIIHFLNNLGFGPLSLSTKWGSAVFHMKETLWKKGWRSMAFRGVPDMSPYGPWAFCSQYLFNRRAPGGALNHFRGWKGMPGVRCAPSRRTWLPLQRGFDVVFLRGKPKWRDWKNWKITQHLI